MSKRTLARHVAETVAGGFPNRAKRIEQTILAALLTFNGTVEAIVSAQPIPTPKPGEYIDDPEAPCPLF
ncbi:MAG TPA: hypothetical protein PKE12_09790 [Kiritimatiellia bacterium]|nr:hypothetical protein [Kiritimatiellia bacterium]